MYHSGGDIARDEWFRGVNLWLSVCGGGVGSWFGRFFFYKGGFWFIFNGLLYRNPS